MTFNAGQKFGRLTVYGIESKGHSTFWTCICDCGKMCRATTSQLKSGLKKSCGCLRKELASALRDKTGGNTLPSGESNFNKIFYQYKIDAKRRNLIFELSKEQFKKLIDQRCHYCDAKPSDGFIDRKTNGAYPHNGIDRKNNSFGYTIANCVPCCPRCNRMKMGLDYYDFIAQCGVIHLFNKMRDREFN